MGSQLGHRKSCGHLLQIPSARSMLSRSVEDLGGKEAASRTVVRVGVGIDDHIQGKAFLDGLQTLGPAARIDQDGHLVRDQDRMGKGETPPVFAVYKVDVLLYFLDFHGFHFGNDERRKDDYHTRFARARREHRERTF